MPGFKKIWKYLRVKLNITITPPPGYRVRSFSIRRIFPIFVLIVIIFTISILGYLHHYYSTSYSAAREELRELKGVREENRDLKREVYALSRDTRELNEALSSLEENNREIKRMINEEEEAETESEEEPGLNLDLQLTSVFSYNENFLQQGIPVGGREMQLYYQDPRALVEQMQSSIDNLQEEVPDQREGLEELESSVEDYNSEKAATPSIWPLGDKGEGYITSEFGWRSDPFTGEQEYHEGLDIGVWYNTPVLAAANGDVEFVGFKTGYGYMVKINHGYGYETIYGHLNKIEVSKGESVRRGEIIARSGNTGRSKGPHLHYEVRVNGVPEDPLEFINNQNR